jgi:arginine utilization protein RocB
MDGFIGISYNCQRNDETSSLLLVKMKGMKETKKKETFAEFLKRIIAEFVAFEEEVDERSKIVPVSAEEDALMKRINEALGRGDKSKALSLLEQGHKDGVIPDIRYSQIKNTLINIDYSAFYRK